MIIKSRETRESQISFDGDYCNRFCNELEHTEIENIRGDVFEFAWCKLYNAKLEFDTDKIVRCETCKTRNK